MINIRQVLAQALFYAIFFVPLIYFTSAPSYKTLAADTAVLKVAIRHAGKIIGECTSLSSDEFARLAPNMKRPESCPRERSPLQLELRLDGRALYRATVPPSGLHNDGMSSMYQRFEVPAGSHHLQIFMNDDVAVEGPTWVLEQDIRLAPAQVMVAKFREGFRLQ